MITRYSRTAPRLPDRLKTYQEETFRRDYAFTDMQRQVAALVAAQAASAPSSRAVGGGETVIKAVSSLLLAESDQFNSAPIPLF